VFVLSGCTAIFWNCRGDALNCERTNSIGGALPQAMPFKLDQLACMIKRSVEVLLHLLCADRTRLSGQLAAIVAHPRTANITATHT
jgi:hypothetical protein